MKIIIFNTEGNICMNIYKHWVINVKPIQTSLSAYGKQVYGNPFGFIPI